MIEALSDDLNTAQAMAVLHGLRNAAASAARRTRRVCGLAPAARLPLESAAAWKGRKQQASGVDAREVDRLIADRAAARARKDFKESDRIRDELAAMGVAIKDSKEPMASRDHVGDRVMAKPDTPFPRHWLYYIAS